MSTREPPASAKATVSAPVTAQPEQPAPKPAAAKPGPRKRIANGAVPAISPEEFGYDEARHLLWRAGFGGTPQQVQTLATWGPERAVDYLLEVDKVTSEPATIEQFDKNIMRRPTAAEREQYRQAQQKRDEDTLARLRLMKQDAQRQDREQMRAIQRWWLTRLIETPRPLEEKMTLFWHGHFATSYRTIEDSWHMASQNQLYRKHAVGSFGDLLFAIIRDPAMLAYLNNNESRKGHPNENLAREIMELFSLGVGNYTEDDIKEGARALTGYSFEDDEFVFKKADHDTGNKQILRHAGPMDGDAFVTAILEQRACSQHLTRKLYKFFAADLPGTEKETDPETNTLLRELASTFLDKRYSVKPVLRQLFLSKHFYSPKIRAQQIKSPVQLVVGAVRSLNTPVRDLNILLDAMDLMGQSLFYPPSVKGWDGGRSWVNTSTLFVRQNILAFLLTGKKPQGYDPMAQVEKYDPKELLDTLAKGDEQAEKEAGSVVAMLLRFAVGRAPAHAQDSLTKFLSDHKDGITTEAATGLLLLITAMPEYQLC
jgi:uncharacterized protein (DUF1800 family)